MPETDKKAAKKPAKTPKAPPKAKGVMSPAKSPEQPRSVGRPTKYNKQIADLICLLLSEGMSLRQIVKQKSSIPMPAQPTVYEWLLQYPEFAEQYARARREQADTNFDEILEIADEMPPEYTDDRGRTTLDTTYLAWQKQRIDARKWTASKLLPKKYGERMAVEGVEGGAAIKTEDTNADRFLEIIRNMEMNKRAG